MIGQTLRDLTADIRVAEFRSLRAGTLIRFFCCAAAVLAIGWASSSAIAAPKTDVVVLRNGDHITGEVKELKYGQLTLSTDDVGTLYIESDKIVSITTNQLLHVDLANGERLFGTAPAPASQPGAISLIQFDGAPTAIEVSMSDIVRIATVEHSESWYKNLDGSFSLGFSYTKATDLKVLNVAAAVGSRDLKKRWQISFESEVTRESGDESSERDSLITTVERFLPDRYFVESNLEFTRNQELGLDLRSLIGATFGRYLVQSNNREWRAGAGLAASTEKESDGNTRDSIEAQLSTSVRMFRYDHPKTDVTASLSVLPSLTESGRVRSEFSLRAKREFITDLFFEISVYNSYDNKPAEGAVTNDWGLSTSIGYTF